MCVARTGRPSPVLYAWAAEMFVNLSRLDGAARHQIVDCGAVKGLCKFAATPVSGGDGVSAPGVAAIMETLSLLATASAACARRVDKYMRRCGLVINPPGVPGGGKVLY